MKNYPKYIKNTLFSVIHEMAKHPEDFCRCPGKDFTRDRKLPFEKVLTLFVKMGGHSLRDEMLDCLDFKGLPASVSALVQQRSKLLPEALEYLFGNLQTDVTSQSCTKDTGCWLQTAPIYNSPLILMIRCPIFLVSMVKNHTAFCI